MDITLRESQASDEHLLQDMLDASPMSIVGMQVVYDRRPTFSALLSYQAESFRTLIGFKLEQLVGFVSFSWGTRLVDGKKIKALYLGDFRVKLTRRAGLTWRSFYPKLIRSFLTEPEFGPTQVIYTAILKENKAAYLSLVKKRNQKEFHYHHLVDLTMVNILAKIPNPFREKTPEPFVVRTGDQVGEKKLREFLVKVNQSIYLGYDFSDAPGNEWDRRLKTWPSYDLNSFLVVMDKDDSTSTILGVTLPWSPSGAKRLKITSLNLPLTLFCKLLNRVGVKAPEVNHPIDVLYLTHLYFDQDVSTEKRASALNTIIEYLSSSGIKRNYHMISFADGANLRKEPSLKSYVVQETEVEVFTVSTDEKGLLLPENLEVSFEMALV